MTLGEFLTATGREVEDVYRAGCWTALRVRAGLVSEVSENVIDLTGRFVKLLHTDDVTRLQTWRGLMASDAPTYPQCLSKIDFQLNRFGVLREPVDVARCSSRTRFVTSSRSSRTFSRSG